MPGSSASPSDVSSKAKVTSAAANGGIFVRPVAVAGIFCPANDSNNKPPALPEKRRFSTLTGDLRPYSSDSGPAIEDLNRRRQSWDTKQKIAAPFSQALLRKTPRNNAVVTASRKLEETKNDSNDPAVLDVQISANSLSNKNSSLDIATISDNSEQVKLCTVSSTLENRCPVNCTTDKSEIKQVVNVNCSGEKANDCDTKSENCAVTKIKSVDCSKINFPSVTSTNAYSTPDVHSNSNSKISVSNKNEEIKIISSIENSKQSKKVYGLIKKESRPEISNTRNDNDIVNKNGSPNKIKVYGVNKSHFKKDWETDDQGQKSQIKPTSDEYIPSKNSKVVNHKSTESETSNEFLGQTDVIRPSISPPKEFRTVRRTSDVIAAKIQNIFSNFQSELSSQSPHRKSQIIGKTKTEISKAEIGNFIKNEFAISNDESPKIGKEEDKKTTTSDSSKLHVSTEKQDNKTRLTEDKSNDKSLTDFSNFKTNLSKHSDNTGVKNEILPLSKNAAFNTQDDEIAQVNDFKFGSFRTSTVSKTECSINALSQKPRVADTEGKMPIKKADQNSLCSMNIPFSTTNGKSDQRSSDSSASLYTSIENANKRSRGAAKKQSALVSSIVTCPDSGKNTTSPSSPLKVVKNCSLTETKLPEDVKQSFENQSHLKETSHGLSNLLPQSLISINSDQRRSYSPSSGSTPKNELQKTSEASKIILSEDTVGTEISKVEVTKITQSTIPGIVPTVNVLFRTKSPQEIANRDENRKKVVIETYTSDAPISSSVIISKPSPTNSCFSNAADSVKATLKDIEDVKKSLNPSYTVRKKLSIVNLKKEELVTVSLSSNVNGIESQTISNCSGGCDVSNGILCVGQDAANCIDPKIPTSHKSATDKVNSDKDKTVTPFTPSRMERMNLSSDSHLVSEDTRKNKGSKMSVVDIGDWNKKFQHLESETPRPPLRRRALRDSLPPSLPLRSISRYGSLRRIEDSPRYLPRSPSQSSLPQRYSYTEMLSKVCSMGVLPFVEPMNSKSCSSSSSQVSELWSELSEEQSTATHASEMLEAETSERMRLEKEVHELQSRYSQVQQRSDKMEMEMIETRMYRSPELNGDLSEDDETDGNSSIYKQKYERAVRDMEIMKRRMQQQEEEETEQKAMMKKTSEKRLAEVLEDVEEERQIANQWKRKAQKLGAELQDLRLMLEEQMGRNGELEKKQRRFDAELSSAQEEIKKERLLREKLMREKDQAMSEKYSLEQDLQTSKLDSDMLHEKITQLNRELDELTLSSKGEEEVTQLKRAKQELERKARDQEEELEELAAQVQMLEQAKLRLEMSLEKLRQEHRREASVREEEIEEIRASFSKKIKNLEAQLEAEQDERHQIMKQKHELERRIYELADQPPPQDPEIERRLRRDLKRTKALLRDAQSMLEHTREGQSSKTLIRQLKNQLEDSEFAKATAVKARQAIETELQECQLQLEEVTRTKNDTESRCLQLSREKSAIQTQLEEAEEEMAEVMKKYKAVVAQMSIDQKTLAEQNQQIAELETERQMLKDQLSEVSHKFEHLAGQSDDTHKVHWLDSKVRDLESKLELEQTTKTRLENQIARLKEQNDRSREECDSLRNKEMQAQEGVRRIQRQLRDLREDYSALQQKEADAYRKQHELEMALENTETDLQVTKNDLRLACQRIQDLQNALEDDLDSGTDVPDDSGSESDDSFELSMLRNQSITPVQRCESVASNLSYCTIEEQRSRTSSFSRELSAFSSRDDVEKDINGFPGVTNSQGLNVENDETI